MDPEDFYEELEKLINGLPPTNEEEEEYKRGYRAGYRDALEYVRDWLQELVPEYPFTNHVT